MNRLFIYIFRVSFIALYNIDKVNFSRWSKIKNKLNYLINKRIFTWMAKDYNSKKYGFSDQIVLDVIIEVIFLHYRQRVKIYNVLKKFPGLKRNIFIIISFVILTIGLIGKFLKEIFSMLYVYNKQKVSDNEIVNISLNFPKHSFSLINKVNPNHYYSFGEYLRINHKKKQLISIGEYVRISKDSPSENFLLEFKRIKPTRDKKFFVFINRLMKTSFSLIFKKNHFNKGFLLKIVYARKFFYQCNFNYMLSDIGLSNKNIGKIFTLSYADIGLLKYNKEIIKKLIAFSYSQNSEVSPTASFKQNSNEVNFFRHLPLFPLILSENSYGFTSLYSNINKIKERLNTEYLLKLSFTYQTEKEKPLALGYEKVRFPLHTEKKLKKQRIVAIFDVPPRLDNHEMTISTIGDKTSALVFIEQFIKDTVETSISNGFGIIIKPKYSLKNYAQGYLNILNTLKEKYQDKLTIANPYIRIGTIVEFSHKSINFPYTSTKLIFQNNNIPSIYYIPDKYKKAFISNGSSDINYGLKSLSAFLKEID